MILLHIISPNGTILKKEVEEVYMSGVDGPFTVLDGHAPMIAALREGVIKFKINDNVESIEVGSGFAEIEDDYIKVCVD
ncbi:MAG: ATP synthase F1 subunit epsilon [Bacteroidales bacterium]|nr:ATP synthase F1 subunit epsilon [Bacteroidales bacterium]